MDSKQQTLTYEAPTRPRAAGVGITVLQLVALWVVFLAVHIHTGLWAIPVFVPLLVWMIACVFAGRTLRPRALAGLHGAARLVPLAAALALFCWVWTIWQAPARHAWGTHHGGLNLLGGSFSQPSLGAPHFPYGAVVASRPALMVALCLLRTASIRRPPGGPSRRPAASRGSSGPGTCQGPPYGPPTAGADAPTH